MTVKAFSCSYPEAAARRCSFLLVNFDILIYFLVLEEQFKMSKQRLFVTGLYFFFKSRSILPAHFSMFFKKETYSAVVNEAAELEQFDVSVWLKFR